MSKKLATSATTTSANDSKPTKKKVKAPDLIVPSWKEDNTHAKILSHIVRVDEVAYIPNDVKAVLIATMKRIITLGEKQHDRVAKTEGRLRKKLAKLAEESKKAGIDISKLLG